MAAPCHLGFYPPLTDDPRRIECAAYVLVKVREQTLHSVQGQLALPTTLFVLSWVKKTVQRIFNTFPIRCATFTDGLR